MKVLFYVMGYFYFTEVSLGMIRTLVPEDDLEVIKNFKDLNNKLNQLTVDDQIAVICVRNKEELSQFCAMGRLLKRLKLILVLPCQDEGIVSLAHRIKPRYLASTNEDPQQIAQVMEKMLKRAEAVQILQ